MWLINQERTTGTWTKVVRLYECEVYVNGELFYSYDKEDAQKKAEEIFKAMDLENNFCIMHTKHPESVAKEYIENNKRLKNRLNKLTRQL